jgi:hypothetical protein
MIGENVLSNLSSEEFKDLFGNEINYRAQAISTQITNYLEELISKHHYFLKNHWKI